MILLTGGTGQLGTAFRHRLDDVLAPSRSDFDLSRPRSLASALAEMRPSAILNCAAYTDVDRAEKEPELAMAVNGESVEALAEYARRGSIPFVSFSTDYVFDGTATEPYRESAPINPINTYGVSKAHGEQAALAANPDALIVRTSWLASATHSNFVTWVLERASRGPVAVVSDQVGSPTYTRDLAHATLGAVDLGATGILHLTNSGEASRFELARTACDTAGIDPSRVEPISSDQSASTARRPLYSPLSSERLADLGLEPLRPWDLAISDLVRALPAR